MRSEWEITQAIEQHGDTIRRICLIHLKNYADTEDIFQNVFLKYALNSAVLKAMNMKRLGLFVLR